MNKLEILTATEIHALETNCQTEYKGVNNFEDITDSIPNLVCHNEQKSCKYCDRTFRSGAGLKHHQRVCVIRLKSITKMITQDDPVLQNSNNVIGVVKTQTTQYTTRR